MGFLNGRVTYVRYRVGGDAPLKFDSDILERVEAHAVGSHQRAGLRLGQARR